jgi:hypothetical protein
MLRSLRSFATPALIRPLKPYLIEEVVEANSACMQLH